MAQTKQRNFRPDVKSEYDEIEQAARIKDYRKSKMNSNTNADRDFYEDDPRFSMYEKYLD